jgi:hypothetical protein
VYKYIYLYCISKKEILDQHGHGTTRVRRQIHSTRGGRGIPPLVGCAVRFDDGLGVPGTGCEFNLVVPWADASVGESLESPRRQLR